MSLHIFKGYHFTEENVLSLLEQLNTCNANFLYNLYEQYEGNRIFIYNLKGEIIEYRYFVSPDWYPYIYIYDDMYAYNERTGRDQPNENRININEFAKDLISNRLYKIEQNYTKLNKDYNDIINVIHMWIE